MKLARSVMLPLLLLLGIVPGGRAYDAYAFGTRAGTAASYTHTIDSASPAGSTMALQQGSATTVAHLAIAPRQAWQSRHEHLRPRWDTPLPASSVSHASRLDMRDSYVAMIRIAVTGSVSFRATSLPPPTL